MSIISLKAANTQALAAVRKNKQNIVKSIT